MKRFIKLLFLFILIIVSVAYSLDYIISKGLRKTDTIQFQVWNDIFSSNINSDVVINGNSRGFCSYDTKILDSITKHNFYNLSIDGHPINYQIIRYDTFRRFNKKPKYIIQNIDYASMYFRNDGYMREQFFPFIFDDTLMSIVSKDKLYSFTDIKLPLIRYFGYRTFIEEGFLSYFGKKNFEDGGLIKGYRGENYIPNFSELKKKNSIYYYKEKRAILLLENYLLKCKREGITVIFVSAPIYTVATKKIYNFEGLKEMFKGIAKKNNIKILEYSNDSICYDISNFYNGTHLNQKGAELFSTKLANDLKAIKFFEEKK